MYVQMYDGHVNNKRERSNLLQTVKLLGLRKDAKYQNKLQA